MESKLGIKVSYSDLYDPNLLDFIPRAERRKSYATQMFGGDIWTCYEVSFLLSNGAPQYHILRLFNPADSEFIFESKSLKLYLNSFNNTKFSSIEEVISIIQRDLNQGVKGDVLVYDISEFNNNPTSNSIDELVREIDFTEYNYNPKLLRVESLYTSGESFSSNLLRSNCEVTGQPDWANIYVAYSGPMKLNLESFLQYIVSYRSHQEFHEPTCERIYNDLFNVLSPLELIVICQYTRRGGIDINPIRTNLNSINPENLTIDLSKLIQQ